MPTKTRDMSRDMRDKGSVTETLPRRGRESLVTADGHEEFLKKPLTTVDRDRLVRYIRQAQALIHIGKATDAANLLAGIAAALENR